MPAPPKVFISYASEDQAQLDWVKELSGRLRADGFDVSLDRWGARPGDELTRFIGQSRRDDCFLLLICTPTYKEIFDRRLQRVDYEASNAARGIQEGLARRSVIPIHRGGSWHEAAPSVVFGDFYIDLTATPMRDGAYLNLVDTLQAQLWVAPTIDDGAEALFEGPGAVPARSIANFLGRDAELATLAANLNAPGGRTLPVVVSGAGGVGKTAVARQFVATHGPTLFPEGVIWLDGQNLAQELARAARRYGWNAETDPTPEQAAISLNKELPGVGVLIVIDDLSDEKLLAYVPQPGGKSRTIVTSRRENLDIRGKTLRLERWSRAISRTYLRQAVSRLDRESDDDLDLLSGFVQGLPLGLVMMSGVFASEKKRSAEEYLARLRAEPLGALRGFVKDGDRGLVGTFLEAYRGLSANERRVLGAIAACAQGTRQEIVAAVAGLEGSGCAHQLRRLTELFLVEHREGADAPWALHDVVRMFTRALPDAEDADAAHLAWVRDHLRPTAEQAPREVSESEMAEAVTALERQLDAEDGAWMGPLFQLLYKHLTSKGRYATAVDLGERLLALEGSLPTLESQASLLGNLGIWQGRLGNMPKAIGFLERSLAISETLGRLDSQAIQLGNLGNCYLTLGDVPNAIEFLLLSLAINEQLGRVEDEALLLGNLGLAHRKLGSILQSIGYHHRALSIHERLGRLDSQAAQLGHLGFCYREQGDFRRAIDFHERALAIYERLERLDGQAVQLNHIVSCCEMLGDMPLAAQFLELSLASFVDSGLAETHPTMMKFRRMLSVAMGDRVA
jgi:tetratricopeptide (TPR) repeat protein